jgi:hypothetical protein
MVKQWTVVGAGMLLACLAGCTGKQEATAPVAAAPAGLTEALALEAYQAAVAREEAATLDGGENLNRMAENVEKRQLGQFDTDKDGKDDVVVGVVWLQQPGGDYSEQKLLAWRYSGDKLAELDVSEVPGGRIGSYKVDGSTLSVDYLMHTPTDEACCPSAVDTRLFEIAQTNIVS